MSHFSIIIADKQTLLMVCILIARLLTKIYIMYYLIAKENLF